MTRIIMKLISVLIFCACVITTRCFWTEDMEVDNLYQGDIVLDPDERKHVANGTRMYASIKGGNWYNGVVPYVVSDELGEIGLQAVNRAIEQYHKFTCLRFVKRTWQREYLHFVYGVGCSSPVGYRRGRVNRVTLGKFCRSVGIAMHEIGHSLGFYHEQSRPDRNQYIKVHFENIKPGEGYNFAESPEPIDSLGTPYDLESIMHYARNAFSKNGRDTIEVLDRKKRFMIGNRERFSNIDIQQINLKYECDIKIKQYPPFVCEDEFDTCPKYKGEGYCDRSDKEEWMFHHCCLTCGYGDTFTTLPPPTGDCVNKEMTSTCNKRASSGYCKDPKWDYLMKRDCCKTCRDWDLDK